jgi:hypothetical protein
LLCSAKMASGSAALAATYALIIIARLINNSAVWFGGLSLLGLDDHRLVISGSTAPVAVYASLVVIMLRITLAEGKNHVTAGQMPRKPSPQT